MANRAVETRKAESKGSQQRKRNKKQSGLGVNRTRTRCSPRSSSNNKRPSFNSEIRSAIPVGKGQARCHLISYQDIDTNVRAICRRTDEEGPEWFREEMTKLWYAVTGKETLSCVYEDSLDNFLGDAISRNKAIREIVKILNNQRGNLRLGASGTNSSIGSALDLPVAATKIKTLPEDTVYTEVWRAPDGFFEERHILKENMTVILITDEALIKRLIEILDIPTPVEPSVYTTGDTVQSSDNPDQSSGGDLPEGRPIGFYVGRRFTRRPLYYLFTPDN